MKPGTAHAALLLASLGTAACNPLQSSDRQGTETVDVIVTAGRGAPTPVARANAPANKVPHTPLLTPEGYGPVRIGMTLAEVTAAMGPDADPNAVGGPDPEQCDQYRPARAPEDMLLMMEDGRLTRISLIDKSKVQTERGIGLGSAPAAVEAAYGKAARVSPHKYVDAPARYITVWTRNAPPDPDGAVSPEARGIVYEVGANGRVEAIHTGGPSIQYVEGCS